ncbi:MAG: dihydroneopterin aldolase [Ginsengibacter sp.]
MITVQLHDLLFIAFHGIHEEERILGNEYIVDASIEFDEKKDLIIHINDTINYAVIYGIIQKKMSIPTPLLETLVMDMGNEIQNQFPFSKSISISIKKMHPPIEGMQGSAAVKWHKEF